MDFVDDLILDVHHKDFTSLLSKLESGLIWTGKNINDFGDMKKCNKNSSQ